MQINLQPYIYYKKNSIPMNACQFKLDKCILQDGDY